MEPGAIVPPTKLQRVGDLGKIELIVLRHFLAIDLTKARTDAAGNLEHPPLKSLPANEERQVFPRKRPSGEVIVDAFHRPDKSGGFIIQGAQSAPEDLKNMLAFDFRLECNLRAGKKTLLRLALRPLRNHE